MEVIMDFGFEELKKQCWSGAEDVLKDIEDAGLEDAFMDLLGELFFEEPPTMTEVNDYIRFEAPNWLNDVLGEQSTDDIDHILTYFKNNSMSNYHLISMEDDEKVLKVAEQFDTIKEFYEAIEPYDTFDEFYSEYMENEE